jgi:GAF domain-containing protein
VNGFAIGVAYVLYQIGPKEQPFSADLVWQAVAIAAVSGILLELANLLFLAKRQKISRLSAELEEARANGRAIEQKLREAGKI